MYNVTNLYKDKIQSLSRTFAISINIKHSKGTLVLEDGDFAIGSFKHEESSLGSEDFTVGGIYGSNIEFTIINDDKYKDIDFMGATVTPTVGLLLSDNIIQYETWMDLNGYTWRTMTSKSWDELFKEVEGGEGDSGTMEYVPLGVFNIDTVDEHRTTTEIRAIDDMLKLDKSYNLSQQVYPASLKDIYIDICNRGGVSYNTQSFPNDNYMVKERPDGDFSFRDILSYVAELSGTFAQFNRLGSLELKWYTNSGITITPDNRSEFVAKKFQIQVTGVSKTLQYEEPGDDFDEDEISTYASGDEKDTVYLAGEEGYVIDLSENPLLQEDFQPVLQTVFNQIKDLRFNPYDATWQGNPAIQAGDMVTHESVGRELENGVIGDGEVFNTIVTGSTYVYRGAGTLKASGMPEESRQFSGSSINKIKKDINIENNKEISRLDKEREQAGQLIANMMGGHFISTEDAIYIADNPDLEEAKKIWKWGIGGFGYFEDGIYDEDGNANEPLTAVTMEGSIVAELISAGIVSADYIETGTLAGKGGNTWINLDNGHFQLGGLMQDEDGFRIEYGGSNLEDDLDDIKNSIEDNKPVYRWEVYSNEYNGGNSDGSDLTTDITGTRYVGIADNKSSPIPSMFPKDYRWATRVGSDGEDGKDGKDGSDGTSINIIGSLEDISELPTNAEIGDAYIIDGELWVWTGDKFENMGTIKGEDGVSYRVWIRYSQYEDGGNPDGSQLFPSSLNMKYIGTATSLDIVNPPKQPSQYEWSKIVGDDGNSLDSFTEYYLATDLKTGVNEQTAGWSTEIRDYNEINNYLWNFEVMTFSDAPTQSTTPRIIGVWGIEGQDGVGIESITEYYLASPLDKGITNKSHGFSTTPQPIDEVNPYLWNYEVIKYTDGKSKSTDAVIVGVFGKDGEPGKDGYEGKDALIGVLTSDTHTFPTDENGKISNFSGGSTEFRVYRGTMDDTKNWKIRVSSSQSVQGSLVGNKYTITGMTSDAGSVRFVASRGGFPDVEKEFKVSTSSAGADATSYWMVVDTKILKEDVKGRYSPDSINITAMRQSGSTEPEEFKARFEIMDKGSEDDVHTIRYRTSHGADESTLSYTPRKDIDSIKVSMYKGSFMDRLDQELIVVLRDGFDGKDGRTPIKGSDYFDGEDGQNGETQNIWIRYSDKFNGGNLGSGDMYVKPGNRKYIGIGTSTNGTPPLDPLSYTWSLYVGTDGVKGEDGEDGESRYLHIKYSNDGGKNFTRNPSTNVRDGETFGLWIGQYVDDVEKDSMFTNRYTWNRIVGHDGQNGSDGKDGVSDHIWIRYSQYFNGLEMTSNPAGAKYIGVAKTEVNYAPSSYSLYTWSKFVAEDGVRGEAGDNSYTHIKYSNNGTSFTSNNGETIGDWIGIYTDFSRQDSNYFWDYKWRKIKGDDGRPGSNGISVESVDVWYRLSDSRITLTSNYNWKTQLSTADFRKGKFIWSRTVTTYSQGSDTFSEASLITGNDGSNGENGRNMTGIEELYYLSASSTTRTSGSYWSNNPHKWKPGHYMWTKSRMTWDKAPLTTETTPIVDRAWETINGIDAELEEVSLVVSENKNAITGKVSKGDLGSSFELTAGKFEVNAKKIDLTGHVTVLSDLVKTVGGKKSLGTLTAGQIDGITLSGNTITGGSIGIGGTSRNRAFEITSDGRLYAGKGGFSVPPDADGIFNRFSSPGESTLAARWKYDNSNYIYQNTQDVRFYRGGESYVHFGKPDGEHFGMRFGSTLSEGSTIKSLSKNQRQIQFRDGRDNVFIEIAASDFKVASSRDFKKDIVTTSPKLDLVRNTQVYDFKFKEDESETTKTGFIAEESPSEIVTDLNVEEGEIGISLMDTVSTLWKAVQELTEKVDSLEKELESK